jgi:hypothetical protein
VLDFSKTHSYPLIPKLNKFNQLLDLFCKHIPSFRPVPSYVKEGAKLILSIIESHNYPTQGRYLEAFVIASLGIARGDERPGDLQDLVNRGESIFGRRVPQGQIRNTFNGLKTFLKYHHLYERCYHKPKGIFTPEDRKILSFLRSREKILQR